MESYIRNGCLSSKELEIILNEVSRYRNKAFKASLHSSTGPKYNPELRSGSIFFTSTMESKRTFNILQSIVLEKYFNIKYNLTNISSVQYARYNKGDKFTWHQDIVPQGDQLFRSFTMSLNISPESEYEGGELLVKHNGKILKLDKKQGSYIIFPSFLYHQASEVMSGVREAIVVWSQSTMPEINEIKREYESNFGRSFEDGKTINIE